jgi:hypothetical protein
MLSISATTRRLDRGDVDLFHLHHCIERSLGGSSVGIGDRLCQCQRRDLPRQSPFVLAPAAVTLLSTIADDRILIAIRFGLVSGCDLKRERLVMLERRPSVETEARNAHYGEQNGQHISFLPRRKVPRCAVYCVNGRVWKGSGVKPCRVLGVPVIPKTNRVLCYLCHVVGFHHLAPV